jgi:NAD(P)-dependent dehydrogenase (short-subunit alcohol dehydrogenase family)
VFRLAERRVVVTGAASGIGLAIARLFASSGASVALVDLNADKVAEAAQSIAAATGAIAAGIACDVSSPESVEQAFAQVPQLLGADADTLVNSAGIAHIGTILTTTPADLDRLYNVNIRGTYLTMQAALKPMLAAGRGVIVNMASIAGSSGIPDRFAYSMTKGAVRAMTLSVARDTIAQGIRCNCISPARVHTPFVDGYLAKNYPGHEAEQMKVLAAAQPIGRMGTPDEIAQLALYLASDEASFITGTDTLIDGGFMNLR